MKRKDTFSESNISNKAKTLILSLIIILLLVTILIACFSCINRKNHKSESLIKRGNDYFDKLDYVNAESCYKEAVSLESDKADGYMALEKVYLAENNLSDAVAVLEAGYKKTNEEAILIELERIKEDSYNELEVNRSTLLVTEELENSVVSETVSFFQKDNTNKLPGTVKENNPKIPKVAPGEVEALIEANKNNESEKSDKNNSKAEGSTESAAENKDDKNENEAEANERIKININGNEKTVSPEQWKRWYHQWKLNNFDSSDLKFQENEWKLWYQKIYDGNIGADGKIPEELELVNENNFREFWNWLSENL